MRDYLPLSPGYSPEYSFDFYYIFTSSTTGFEARTREASGTLKIETRQYEEESGHTSLVVSSIFTENTDSGATVTTQDYSLFMRPDSLWYVFEYTDFEKMEKGTFELMMHRPQEGSKWYQMVNLLDLKLLSCPGWGSYFEDHLGIEYSGDTLIYIDQANYPESYAKRAKIKFVKDVGLVSFDYLWHSGGNWTSPHSNTYEKKTLKFNLIE